MTTPDQTTYTTDQTKRKNKLDAKYQSEIDRLKLLGDIDGVDKIRELIEIEIKESNI